MTDIIAPGATIGILGGGQLGRMTALAAARLGYRCHVFAPEANGPAQQVAAERTVATYADRMALDQFAAVVDVVTYEFENIPVGPVEHLAEIVPVRPGANALRIAQDRIREKGALVEAGVPTAAFAAVRSATDIAAAVEAAGLPAVLKTARLGYDGKGQARVADAAAAAAAWHAAGEVDAILEAYVPFACEISVIVARGLDGALAAFPAVENRHVAHILDTTIVPAEIAPETAAGAGRIAGRLAEALDIVGLLAVEMFVTIDGALLVNEIAPRPHNSGHWTIDACATSQFEQLVRAICGLPLGATDMLFPAEMKNLIGADVETWRDHLARPGARLHLYGKTETRPGRKMGHVTWRREAD